MPRRLTRSLIWGVALLVAVVVLADTGLRFVDLHGMPKDWLVRYAARHGWTIAISGPMRARLLPLPYADVQQFSLTDRHGEKLLAAREATFALVFEHGLRVEFAAYSPEIFARFDREGRLNWQRPKSHRTTVAPPDAHIVVHDGAIIVQDARRAGARLAIEHADIDLLLDRDSFAGKAGLSVGDGRVRLKVGLAQAGNDGLSGPLTLSVESLASLFGAWAKFQDKAPPDLGPGFLGSFDLASVLTWKDGSLSLDKASFALGRTKGTGRARVAWAPHLDASMTVNIDELQFADFMTGHAHWLSLAQLFANTSTAVLDAMHQDDTANFALAIGKGYFKDRPAEVIDLGVDLRNRTGTLTASADLPGATHFHLQSSLQGEAGKLQVEGLIKLAGVSPASTLHWLMPDLPTPESIAAAPFDISIAVTPHGQVHEATADMLLNGVRGHAMARLKTGPRAELDATFDIPSLDLLSYVSAGKRFGLQSLRLAGLDLKLQAAIDTEDPSLPMDVAKAELRLREVAARLSPSAAPAKPGPRAAVKEPFLDAETTRAFGGWLAALPTRLDDYTHAGPAQSTLAKAFPSIQTDLTRLESALYHLNFQSPFRLHADRFVLDQGDRHGTFNDATLGIVTREAPGQRHISTLTAEAGLGAGQFDDMHLDSAALRLEADLYRSGKVTQVSAIRLQQLALEGDIGDPVDPYGDSGTLGLPPAPRRVPVSILARGAADPGHVSATIDRLTAGGVGDFKDIKIEASESGGGLLAVSISNGAAKGTDILPQARCSLATHAGPHVLEFTVELAGEDAELDAAYGLLDAGSVERGPHRPLIRRLSAQGFATKAAAVLDDLRLRLGDASTVAARVAATRLAAGEGLAQLEGCIDASVQDRPRLASLGHVGQDLLLPALAPIWKESAGTTRVGLAGRLQLRPNGLGSGAPLRVSIHHAGRVSEDSFDVELRGLDLRLPDHGKGAAALHLGLQGIGFRDGLGGFQFASPVPGRPVLSFEQMPPVRSCSDQPGMSANIRLGAIDHIDIAAVKRFVAHIGALAKGKDGTVRPSPCDALAVHLTADQVQAWPDLIEAFTDMPGARRAARQAPTLRDLDFTLGVDSRRNVTYGVSTGLVPASEGAGAACAPGETFHSNGTLSFDNGKWHGKLGGVVTCLSLAEVLHIADATVGHRLESPSVSLKAGSFRKIEFHLNVPAFSLTDLSRASGSINWEGNLALEIENSKLKTGLALLKLEDVRRDGLQTTGKLELSDGSIDGTLAFVDPRLDQPDEYRNARREWPNLAKIDLRGNLAGKTIDATVTTRSPDWVGPTERAACFGKATPEYSFPAFVEQMAICVSLTGGKECPAGFSRREPTIADYKCLAR